MTVKCCGEDMMHIGSWFHCSICGVRLREHPLGKEREILAEMVITEVGENGMTWKETQKIFHQLWKAGRYEDYEPEIPEAWK